MKRGLRKVLAVAMAVPMLVGLGVAVDTAASSETARAEAVTKVVVYAPSRIRASQICLYVIGGKTLDPFAYRDSLGRLYYLCQK